MSRLRKRVRIGKYAIPIFLLLTIAVGTAAAVSYVILTWTMTLTVAPHPRIYFYNDVTSTEANTMDIPLNIFPNVKTIEEDADWDIKSTGIGDIYIRVSTLETAKVAKVTIIAYEVDPANPLFTEEWTAATTDWSSAYTTAVADYNLWIEVTGADGAPSGETTVTVDMKVESP